MLLLHYYALVAGAGLLTGSWLFRSQARTAVTTIGAFLAWALAALLGGDTETYRDAGATLQEASDGSFHAVAQGETLVSAPVPEEIRLFATLWALLSALALILTVWGVYPPDDDNPTETTTTNA